MCAHAGRAGRRQTAWQVQREGWARGRPPAAARAQRLTGATLGGRVGRRPACQLRRRGAKRVVLRRGLMQGDSHGEEGCCRQAGELAATTPPRPSQPKPAGRWGEAHAQPVQRLGAPLPARPARRASPPRRRRGAAQRQRPPAGWSCAAPPARRRRGTAPRSAVPRPARPATTGSWRAATPPWTPLQPLGGWGAARRAMWVHRGPWQWRRAAGRADP